MTFVKIVFVTNYFNHHQKPFCEEMYQRLGKDFTFVSTSVMREERKKLGYKQDDRPYICLSYENLEKRREALDLINNADVVIAGAAPNDMLTERIRAGKLLFRYSERPFKKKVSFLKKVYHWLNFRKRDLWKKNIYMLCASAYTAGDYASVGMYKNRTYKWGYFPVVKEYDIEVLLSKKKRNTLMWCGRFIDWKHPDDAILLAKKLKDAGYNFCLNLIGTGDMEKELHQMAEDFDLTDRVHFFGSMTPDQVRAYMEETGIYLFTSDRQEGWGAVLNESMNSSCAVVASHAIGSVPFLIKDGENGLIYQSGNVDMLFEKVKYFLNYPEEQRRVGLAAYQTMRTVWKAEIAADRILQLSERLLAEKIYPDLYETGPCSKAIDLEDIWFEDNM